MAQQILSTNTFTASTWIVNSDATKGTHTTLAGALTSASSGDTILLQSSVTENVTGKAGVNIFAPLGSELTPNVSITGKISFSSAGTFSISGIRFTTNSDNFLAVTGSAASIVNLEHCYLNCLNNTGISYTTASTSSQINLINCRGNIGTTGISLFAMSSTGTLTGDFTIVTNTGAATTASTISAGVGLFKKCMFNFPTTISGTGGANFEYTEANTSATNTTAVTFGGSGAQNFVFAKVAGGSQPAMAMTTATTITTSSIDSSNTNAISGSGTLSFNSIHFTGSSSTIQPTISGLAVKIGSLVINSALPVTSGGTGLASTTTNQILYSSGTSTIAGLATANNGMLVTSATGVPSIQAISSFSAYLNASVNNVTGNATLYTVICNTKSYDVLTDYSTSTGAFTCRNTGVHQFIFKAYFTGCTIAQSMSLQVVTTSQTYYNQLVRAAGASDFNLQMTVNALMTAGDTAAFKVVITGEAGDTDDIFGDNGAKYDGTYVQGRWIGVA